MSSLPDGTDLADIITTESDERDRTTIRARNVTKWYSGEDVVACEEVNVSVESGELVVILGPSGCGKTTILRSIAGLEPINSGSIFVDGDDISDRPPGERDLAFVFQSPTLFPHKTVRENIRFGIDIKSNLSMSEKRQRVEAAASLLSIEKLLDRSPDELSGGQRQRVSIARALVTDPAGFLLDEPFAALDANLRKELQVEFKKLHRRLKTATLFVTHDQSEAMSLADRIVVIRDGRVQQRGTPGEVYEDPENAFVARFIGSPSTNFFDGRLRWDRETPVFVHEAFRLPLPECTVSTDSPVTLGVRPEHMSLDDGGHLSGRVDLVEHQGNQSVMHIDIGADYQNVRLTAATTDLDPGDPAAVSFSASDVWLFDDDGSRIG